MCFLPQDEASRDVAMKQFENFLGKSKQNLLGWRDVPVDIKGIGKAVIDSMPVIKQAVIAKGSAAMSQDAFERKLLAIRKETQNPLAEVARKKNLPGLAEFYMPSLSTRTIVYKGLLLAGQVGTFYKDLRIRCAARSRWFTNASRPTPSRPGVLPTPTASLPTMARSTRCAAT